MLYDILLAVGVMVILAIALGLLLAVASKYLEVKVDPRIEAVTAMLPGFNCGACGCAGCADMAASLVKGTKTVISACKPSKADARAKIKEYLDKTPGLDGKIAEVTI